MGDKTPEAGVDAVSLLRGARSALDHLPGAIIFSRATSSSSTAATTDRDRPHVAGVRSAPSTEPRVSEPWCGQSSPEVIRGEQADPRAHATRRSRQFGAPSRPPPQRLRRHEPTSSAPRLERARCAPSSTARNDSVKRRRLPSPRRSCITCTRPRVGSSSPVPERREPRVLLAHLRRDGAETSTSLVRR